MLRTDKETFHFSLVFFFFFFSKSQLRMVGYDQLRNIRLDGFRGFPVFLLFFFFFLLFILFSSTAFYPPGFGGLGRLRSCSNNDPFVWR